jgi:general secretion pathway protein J
MKCSRPAPLCSHLQQASERGFTLVEVLLATALVAVIAAMVFGSLHMSTVAIDRARSTAAREQALRSTLRIMADELTAAVSNPIGPWVGLNSTLEGQPADTVAFLTLGEFRGVESAQNTEMVRIVYTREGDRLLRFVRHNLYGVTDESVDQLELAKRVKAFNLRYYDSRANVWADEWDGRTRNTPPSAVLIELSFMQEDEEVRTFRQWVPIGVRS